MNISALPLRELMRVHRAIRRRFFRVPWPNAPGVVMDHSPAEADARLRAGHHFESGVTLSYRYDGEVLNLRRPEHPEDIDGHDDVQMQGHIRARKHPDGWEYVAHIEPDPDEHPRLHIDETGFRWDIDWLVSVLEQAGFGV